MNDLNKKFGSKFIRFSFCVFVGLDIIIVFLKLLYSVVYIFVIILFMEWFNKYIGVL